MQVSGTFPALSSNMKKAGGKKTMPKGKGGKKAC